MKLVTGLLSAVLLVPALVCAQAKPPAPAAAPPAAPAAAKPAAAPKPAKVEVGSVAPDFELPVFKGTTFKLSSLKDKKAVVLVFTQTACGSCREELKFVNTLVGSATFDVIAVSVDAIAGTEKWTPLAERYIADNELKMPILTDPGFKVPRLFGVRSTPSMVVIDKAGKVVAIEVGFEPGDSADYEKIIKSLK